MNNPLDVLYLLIPIAIVIIITNSKKIMGVPYKGGKKH